MNSERELFEEAVFDHYRAIKAAGWSNPDEGDMTRESLFWLQPDGLYGVVNLNAAWWAWQKSAERFI